MSKAISEDGYLQSRREILEKNELECHAIGNHLLGQAVCDFPIDARHKVTLPENVWGDGDQEGVRRRAAEEMKDTARAAAAFGVGVVTGFTGSSVWHKLYFFPQPPRKRSRLATKTSPRGGIRSWTSSTRRE